ncbi:MAG: alpha/beta hydrolase, partial [Asticcacaulis sp.]|nr:alpha/beta hydrolase [Asticcacaulis sp.]
MQEQASFSHEAAEGGHGDRASLLRKAPAYQDRWWFTEDGLRLYARDYPASPGRVRLPVICLHGLTRNSADFEDVAPYISRLDRRVIVPDLRGRGLSQSDPDPTNYHLWTYAKDVLDLCDALGIGRAIFIGTSMGALVTMVLSTLRPNLVVSAILNDAGPVLSPKGLARISGLAAMKPVAFRNWHDAAVFCSEQYRLAFPNYVQADWLKFARRAFIKAKDGLLHQAYDPRIMETFRSVTLARGMDDVGACFASLAAGRRLLLIRGALSDVLDAMEAKRLASVAPSLTRVDVDYVGHAPMLTEPQALSAVTDFL